MPKASIEVITVKGLFFYDISIAFKFLKIVFDCLVKVWSMSMCLVLNIV